MMQKSSGYVETERRGGEKKKEHLEVAYYHLIYPANIKANIQQIQKMPGASLSSSLGTGIQLTPTDT